jgi:hypothetical protein
VLPLVDTNFANTHHETIVRLAQDKGRSLDCCAKEAAVSSSISRGLVVKRAAHRSNSAGFAGFARLFRLSRLRLDRRPAV